MAEPKSKTSLYVIPAREAPVAVIFRRGPSKLVKLIKWNTAADTFEHGQWFKGRIYERRCDLSPSGDKLVYFAASQKGAYRTWTAISKPPYLTALALWPVGHTWGGGGRFASEKKVFLSHAEMDLADGFSLPADFTALRWDEDSGEGGDESTCHGECLKYGWSLVQEGVETERKHGSPVWITYDPPRVFSRSFIIQRSAFELRSKLTGVHERNGDWYVIEYEVENLGNGERMDLGRLDWADWDRNGDLLYTRAGRLFRLPREAVAGFDLPAARELADFSDLKFEELVAPEAMRRW